MLADGCEKMSALMSLLVVVAPACMVSKVSALEKSRVGAVMARTRLRSSALRSSRPAGAVGAAAAPAWADAASTAANTSFT
ncbi:hypothetical protein WJ973_13030 [Achromobacter xylosoxidans]